MLKETTEAFEGAQISWLTGIHQSQVSHITHCVMQPLGDPTCWSGSTYWLLTLYFITTNCHGRFVMSEVKCRTSGYKGPLQMITECISTMLHISNNNIKLCSTWMSNSWMIFPETDSWCAFIFLQWYHLQTCTSSPSLHSQSMSTMQTHRPILTYQESKQFQKLNRVVSVYIGFHSAMC